MKKFRISFIAAGRMANTMAAQLKQLDQVELVGVYDPLADRCAQFAPKYAFAKCCSSREELLAEQNLDGVVICNYAHQHCETILATLNAGVKAIFCEKPAIRSLDEAETLRAAVVQANATDDWTSPQARPCLHPTQGDHRLRTARKSLFRQSPLLQRRLFAGLGRLFRQL